MPAFKIVVVRNPANPMISEAFRDVAELLLLSLLTLGHECREDDGTFDPSARNIVLGYHLLAGVDELRRHSCIVYQLEQLPGQREDWLRLDGRKEAALRAASAVWDLSPRNVAYLAGHEIVGVRHVPIGFHPGVQTIAAQAGADPPDIDVLFYGAVNARRKRILDALRGRCRVKAVYGAYGPRRDQLVARAKVVLNLRSSPDTSIMEQPRVAYLLNNRRFVVTEDSDDNPYGDAVASAPYDGLAECCLRYLADPEGRDRMAERGYAFLAARPMTEYLRAALAALPG